MRGEHLQDAAGFFISLYSSNEGLYIPVKFYLWCCKIEADA